MEAVYEAFYNQYRYGFQIGYFNSVDQIQAGLDMGWLDRAHAQRLREEFFNN